MVQEARFWDPRSIPGRDTLFDFPESSCLLSGPGLQPDSRYNKDFSGKVCVKWKDTEFERQVGLRSESLIPCGDAIHAQATVSNRNAAEGALLEQPRSRQTPQEVLILCLGT